MPEMAFWIGVSIGGFLGVLLVLVISAICVWLFDREDRAVLIAPAEHGGISARNQP